MRPMGGLPDLVSNDELGMHTQLKEEGEREKERKKERERERKTDRQTDRQTDRDRQSRNRAKKQQ